MLSKPHLVALCKAVLDYGTSAQLNMNYRLDDLANKGNYYTDLSSIEIPEYSLGYSIHKGEVTKLSASLSLESYTMMNFYVGGSDLSIVSLTCNGEPVDYTPQPQADGSIYIPVSGIAAKELANYYTLTFNTTSGENYISFSPMVYAYANRNGEKYLGELCKDLYNYYSKAKEFFAIENNQAGGE